MKVSAAHTECHVVPTEIQFSIFDCNDGHAKAGHTVITMKIINRLVIFSSVDDVRCIQVHWPRCFSADCSAPLCETRMASEDFTSVGRHASNDFARLFVQKVKRYNIGWTECMAVVTQVCEMRWTDSLI